MSHSDLYCILMASLLFFHTGSPACSANWREFTPLPDVLNIAPSADVQPDDITEFLGVWQGVWHFSDGHGVRTTIVIENIGKNKVSAVYSWGSYTWNETRKLDPGWLRVNGFIKGNSIVLRWGSLEKKFTVTLSLENKMTARAKYSCDSYHAEASLKKRARDKVR